MYRNASKLKIHRFFSFPLIKYKLRQEKVFFETEYQKDYFCVNFTIEVRKEISGRGFLFYREIANFMLNELEC